MRAVETVEGGQAPVVRCGALHGEDFGRRLRYESGLVSTSGLTVTRAPALAPFPSRLRHASTASSPAPGKAGRRRGRVRRPDRCPRARCARARSGRRWDRELANSESSRSWPGDATMPNTRTAPPKMAVATIDAGPVPAARRRRTRCSREERFECRPHPERGPVGQERDQPNGDWRRRGRKPGSTTTGALTVPKRRHAVEGRQLRRHASRVSAIR